MTTAKKLGFGLGDLVSTGQMEGVPFVGVVVGEVNTATPMCEVWGFEQEQGSVYAHQLKKITTAEFIALVQQAGHTLPLKPWNDRSLIGLEQAGVPAEKR